MMIRKSFIALALASIALIYQSVDAMQRKRSRLTLQDKINDIGARVATLEGRAYMQFSSTKADQCELLRCKICRLEEVGQGVRVIPSDEKDCKLGEILIQLTRRVRALEQSRAQGVQREANVVDGCLRAPKNASDDDMPLRPKRNVSTFVKRGSDREASVDDEDDSGVGRSLDEDTGELFFANVVDVFKLPTDTTPDNVMYRVLNVLLCMMIDRKLLPSYDLSQEPTRCLVVRVAKVVLQESDAEDVGAIYRACDTYAQGLHEGENREVRYCSLQKLLADAADYMKSVQNAKQRDSKANKKRMGSFDVNAIDQLKRTVDAAQLKDGQQVEESHIRASVAYAMQMQEWQHKGLDAAMVVGNNACCSCC